MLALYIFLFAVDDMYNCMADTYGCRRRGLGKSLDLCFYLYMKYDQFTPLLFIYHAFIPYLKDTYGFDSPLTSFKELVIKL